MSFNNSSQLVRNMNVNVNNYSPSISLAPTSAQRQPTALNAPMIGRVYKAKPGCSACGKKVA
jgi:hypothetical protein